VAEKAVLLNSGGIDSRVSAAILADIGWELHSLFIDWNPTSSIQSGICARNTADRYCASHTVFAWPMDWMTWYPQLRKSTTPYALLGTYSLAAPYAQHIGADYIASGIRKEVVTSAEWLDAMRTILNVNKFADSKVFLLPVYDLSNDEVTSKGRELGVDMDSTWSCTVSPQCGECESCRRRKGQSLWVR